MKTNRPLSISLAALFLILALVIQLIVPLIIGARLATSKELRPTTSSDNGSVMPGRRVMGMPGSRFLGGTSSTNPSGLVGLAIALLCANVAAGVAAIIAAVGLWRSKRWGMILALIVAVFGIVSSLPGLVGGARFFITALPTLTRVGLLTAVAALSLLPSSLDAYQ